MRLSNALTHFNFCSPLRPSFANKAAFHVCLSLGHFRVSLPTGDFICKAVAPRVSLRGNMKEGLLYFEGYVPLSLNGHLSKTDTWCWSLLFSSRFTYYLFLL